MKTTQKLLTIISLLMISAVVDAQSNTFPSSGNVGIGTTAPVSALTIKQSSDPSLGSDGTGGIRVYNTAGTSFAQLQVNASGVELSSSAGSTDLPLIFNTSRAAIPPMTLTPQGNIGIGVINPESLTNYRIIEARGVTSDYGGIFQSVGYGGSTKTRFYSASGAGYVGTTSNHPFSILTNGTERLTFTNTGNIGIGTSAPDVKLYIVGTNGPAVSSGVSSNASLRLSPTGDVTLDIGVNASSNYSWMQSVDKRTLDANYGLVLNPNGGNVGIGITDPSEKLSVNGNISAKKITVTQSGWPDYVFHPFYRLKPLSEVAQFIKTNQHLPDVPSAKDVEEKGISLGDNQALLLKKIEELTLYLIEMKNENNSMKDRIQQLESRLKK